MGESLTALYLQNPQLAAALRRQAFSQQLGKDATSFEPIQSPWQGVAKLANAGLSAFLMNKEDEDIKGIVEDQNKRSAANAALVASLINPDMSAPGAGGGTPQPSMTAAALQGKPLGNALDQVPAAPAIIHQNESGGAMRPGIYGDGGQAAGPMQVHPGALADVNKRYNTNYTHADLATNPDVGKKVGDAYYGILLEQFGGDQAKATAAYNAGSGRVAAAVQAYGDDWQKGLPPGTQAYLARGAGAQTTQGQGAPQPQQPQGGTMDAPAVMAQAKKMIVVGMNMANSADPRERMMGNELAAQGRHMQNQAQAELTRLDARANRNVQTATIDINGKPTLVQLGPDGSVLKTIGAAPGGNGEEAESRKTLLSLSDKVQNGTASQQELKEYELAYRRLTQDDMKWVPDPTDPTGQRQVMARVEAKPLSGAFPKPNGAAGGLDVVPGTTKDGPQMTTDQAKSAGYADRMHASNQIIAGMNDVGTNQTQQLLGSVPLVGNRLVSSDYQKLEQAQRDFINAKLRQESGAAIAASEFENARKQYFPQPGDGPEVLAQKARNRDLVIQGMAREAGKGYALPKMPEQAAAPPIKAGPEFDAYFDKLPSGATFVGPDGKTRRKP